MIKLIQCILLGLMLSGCASVGQKQWYRGNTHTHTFWSDGNDFPEMAADWYKRNGYHFLVLSDHNVLSRGERWKTLNKQVKDCDVLRKHAARWGKDSLEVEETDGKTRVRLKALDEVRSMVEEPGRFIMIEGLELTSSTRPGGDRKKGLPVHSNAIHVDELLKPGSKATVEKLLAHHEALVTAYMERADHPVFWHINHPNWKYSNTAEQVARVQAAQGLEIFNGGSKCNNLGDEQHPSVVRLWDIINTIRIKALGMPPLFGCGTDDTHNYHTPESHYHSGEELRDAPGIAWVMVRSEELTADAITEAMVHGDFYASTGITLKKLQYDAAAGVLSLEVDPKPGVEYTIRFVGSPVDVSLDHEVPEPIVDKKGVPHPVSGIYSDERLGAELKKVKGPKASYQLTGDELYVRAVVSCDAEDLPVIDSGTIPRMAWTQPIGWKKHIK